MNQVVRTNEGIFSQGQGDYLDKIARELSAACRAGDLAAAYRVILPYDPSELTPIAFRAGFSCIGARPRSQYMQHLQRQIADAARLRVDGWELRNVSKAG
ncbi:hypothetical protein H8A99_42050 [Bradyrhizobium sp. Arg68]|uniref:hypothetical protein n=1 Tax=Bradyrhizobium ivorense TaxID=2511166 RepID=UPI001E3BFB65|nr:hypothetical protein [Bradyrhizobium ivorense]MCC8942822.1 hypothetical protein [Bradyrhizobium ivorense]